MINGYYTTPEISGESVISISYEVNTSRVDASTLNKVKVIGYNGEISIYNIDTPSDVMVYTVDGKLVGNISNAFGDVDIQVPSEQLYIVKVGSRVFNENTKIL